MNKFFTLLLILFSTQIISAQQVVNYQQVAQFSKNQLSAIFPLLYENGVDVYRVEYKSLDVLGQLDTLSGLVVLPDDSTNFYPRVTYMHGTVQHRDSVPSNLTGESDLVLLIGGLGYATAAPDFPGLGIGRGFHPYIHARSEAQSGVDLVKAMEEIAAAEGRLLNDQFFVTGYSQGGHAALAMHKLVEEEFSDEFTVTASSPMSGPYSVSGVMLDFVLAGNEYYFPAYLPNTVLSMQTAYGNIFTDLEEVFKPVYTGMIQQFFEEQVDLIELNAFLVQQLISIEGAPIAIRLFQDDYIAALNAEPNHPLLVAFRDNDLFNWVPEAPSRLLYCVGDDQVPYRNAVVTDSIMNAAGAMDVQAIEVGGVDLDHGDCLIPAILGTRAYFGSFQQIISSTLNQNLTAIKVYPNPTSGLVQFDLPVDTDISQIRVINILGAMEGHFELKGNNLDLGQLSSGLKLLEFVNANGALIGLEKIMVN